MKKLKIGKIVALFLVLILAASLATACNRGNGEDEPGPGPAAPGPGGDLTPPGADDEPDAPPVPMGNIHPITDFGGRTITFLNWYEGEIRGLLWGVHGEGDEPDPETSGDYFIDRLRYDNFRRVMNDFNVTLAFIEAPHDPDVYVPLVVNSVLAGEAVADVVVTPPHFRLNMILGNALIPWDDAREQVPNADVFNAQDYVMQLFSPIIPDTIWAIDRVRVSAPAILGINLDIIHADGLPDPRDLYDQGQWNWENMLDIMRRATRDTTGDGVIDQFGFSGQSGDVLLNFIAANDGIQVSPAPYFQYAIDHPNTLEALELWDAIMGEQLWTYLPGIPTWDWARNFWAGIREANIAIWQTADWAFWSETPDFEWTVMPIPKGPSNTSGATFSSAGPTGVSLIGANNRWEPWELLVLHEEFWSWALGQPELYVEGLTNTFRTLFPTERCVQRILGAVGTGRDDVGNHIAVDGVGFNWMFNDLAESFRGRWRGIMEGIEYHRPHRSHMLDVVFGADRPTGN